MTTHAIIPTLATLHGHFSRELPPVLRFAPGDRVRFQTLDVRWGQPDHADSFSPAPEFPGRDPVRDPGHAMCGPVWIEGARAGMTLEVRVLSLRVGRWGWTSAGGYPSHWNAKLGLEHVPQVRLHWSLDADANLGRDAQGRSVQLRPFLGIMGMPPDEPGRHSTTPPRAGGGNIDCKELVQGSTLFLPIPVEGALFSAGDGHAVQGDGEVAGPALEAPFEVAELEFHLRPDLKLVRPRARTPQAWVTFGFHEDLDEATVQALGDMLVLLDEQLGCGRTQALALSSLVVDLHVTQIVNGVRGVHAMISHEALARLVTKRA